VPLVIVTVTPNPAIDLTYRVDAFTPGASLRVDTARLRAGGKGLNVARVLHRTGSDVVAVTTTGGDTGREFQAELAASGIRSTLVPVAGATRRSVAVVDDAAGETTIMNERGAALSPAEWRSLAASAAAAAQGAACVTGSGSLAPGTPQTFYADLVRAAHDAGAVAIIDAVGEALIAAADAGADLLKPNRSELLETTGESDPIAGARELIGRGARLVLVSLGADGMLAVCDRAPVWHARMPRPLEGNPTGAGDAAVAAAAATFASGERDARAVLARATAWSAAAVLTPVAGELADNYPELEQLVILTEQ
jgi:1-phosphofructokinase family hexose kinase